MKKYSFILFAFAMLAVLVSCSEDDYVCECVTDNGGTGVALLDTIIDTQYIDSLSYHGFSIYSGTPNMLFATADTFRFNPVLMTYSNLAADKAIVGDSAYYSNLKDDCYIIISNQTSSQHISVRRIEQYTFNGALYTTDEKSEGVITGNSDGYFTIYADEMGKVTSTGVEITYKQPLLISGRKTAQGLQNCVLGIIMQAKYNDYNGMLVPVGTIRLFKDLDNMAYYSSLPLGWGKIAAPTK